MGGCDLFSKVAFILRGNMDAYGFLCVVSVALWGLEARENGCDPEFKVNVEGCLYHLQGFPIMAMNKTFISGDWIKTDVICRRELFRIAADCVRQEYARCQQTKAWRSLCGFQNVHPDLLLQYGQAVCKHRDELERHWACQSTRHCSLQSCLDRYRPSLPSTLSVGMWKSSLYSSHCSYHAYTELCHGLYSDADPCSAHYEAQLKIIMSVRPFTCPDEELQQLKERYLESEVYFAAKK